MFCMNCGQQLPDGAKFCLNCGTPQGAVSPTGNTQAETVNLDGMHTFVPAMCPNCNAHMKVDTSTKIARCDTCGTECLVQDAIRTLTVKGNVQIGNATINVSGADTDSLLKRVELMLADGDFNGAKKKFDSILDSDPTNGEAYLLMLMHDLACRKRSDLAKQLEPFDKNKFYRKAIEFGDSNLQAELNGYLDTINTRIESCQKNPQVGDNIFLGRKDGQRMWWKVLKTQNGKAFIISLKSVNNSVYHETGRTTWENCSLRQWLNNEFINKYFNSTEQERILTSRVVNEYNTVYKTPGGSPTNDKVYLLSIKEAKELLPGNKLLIDSWLRSPGSSLDKAAYLKCGKVIEEGGTVYNYYDSFVNMRPVHPVMWIKLDD